MLRCPSACSVAVILTAHMTKCCWFGVDDLAVTRAAAFAVQGAAPLIASKEYLSVAAGILSVEAYHAGEDWVPGTSAALQHNDAGPELCRERPADLKTPLH